MNQFRTSLKFVCSLFLFTACSSGGGGGDGATSSFTSALANTSCEAPQGILNGSCLASSTQSSVCSEFHGVPAGQDAFINQCAQQGGVYATHACPSVNIVGACKMTNHFPEGDMDNILIFYKNAAGLLPSDVQELCADIDDPEDEFFTAEFCQ